MEYDPETHDALAKSILEKVGDNPRLTVNLLASELDSTTDDVVFVLDSFFVQEGVARFEGPGQGGGWIPEHIRVTLVTGYGITPENAGSHIGYRWPDGSLRETPYEEEGSAV